MNNPLKILIPMAGHGTRLRPHTWSRPKQLLPVAGKPFLSHVFDQFKSLPQLLPREFVLVTGEHEDQVRAFMAAEQPDTPTHYVPQVEKLGQSHAIYQARRHLDGPVLMVFPDTLVDADLGFLKPGFDRAAVWVRAVPDPRRFGVVRLDSGSRVAEIIEKPATMDHRKAVVGYYFFPDGAALIDAIERQLVENAHIGGEFYLADAVNLLIEGGLSMDARAVSTWLDAGTPANTLEANAVLLAKGHANFMHAEGVDGGRIVPPVYIHPSASVEGSLVGPNVAIGADCIIRDSAIENCIIDSGAAVAGATLQDSILGRRTRVEGAKGIIQLGDDASFIAA